MNKLNTPQRFEEIAPAFDCNQDSMMGRPDPALPPKILQNYFPEAGTVAQWRVYLKSGATRACYRLKHLSTTCLSLSS